MQYRWCSPHSPLLAVPFPRWGTLRVLASLFDIQRTSDIALILFGQIGIFLSNYFALAMELLSNLF